MSAARRTPRTPLDDAANAMNDIIEVAVRSGQFSTLVAALTVAGLTEALEGKGPFTVFAPSDSAFAELPSGTLHSLLRDKERLAAVLLHHVVPGTIMTRDIVAAGGATIDTLNSLPLTLTVRDGKVYVNGVHVVNADVSASNGVIHVVDEVLVPAAVPASAAE